MEFAFLSYRGQIESDAFNFVRFSNIQTFGNHFVDIFVLSRRELYHVLQIFVLTQLDQKVN